MCTIKRNILLKYTFTSIEVFVFISTNIVYGSLKCVCMKLIIPWNILAYMYMLACLYVTSKLSHCKLEKLHTPKTRLFSRRQGHFLFNDTLNTFYLRLYCVRHIKDHSLSERGNQLPPHVLLFLISSKGSFICIIPQTT